MKILPVISYDPDKVYLSGKKVIKITDEKELLNVDRMRKLIKNQDMPLSDFGKFKIKIPEIELFDCSKLKMEFLSGDTFEALLKTANKFNRNQLLKIIASLLEWFLNNSIVWHDFAPRNVIIDFSRKIIGFVDFERGVTILNNKTDEAEFCFCLSDIVAEEWGAFLTIDEFNYLLPNFWDKAKEINDSPTVLTSKRKIAISKVLCNGKSITMKDAVFISKAMQEVAQAREINGVMVFPLIIIERLTKRFGPDYYAQIISQHWQGR